MKKFEFGSIADSFKTRSFRAGGYSIAATAIVLAIVLAVNMLIGALPSAFTQFDVTTQQMYSISDQTKQVIASLDQDVTIHWIVTVGNEDQYVKRLLERVDELSDHITVVKKDTDVNPTFASKYTSEEVYPNSLVVECGERYRYLNYSGDVYTQDYADYYTTGTYTTYFNGEGALVSAVDYVTNDDLPKLYILTGHGEQALSTIFSTAVKNKNIETVELSLLTVDAVPDDADGILIHTPSSDISETELRMLRDYAAAGGSLMVLTDIKKDGSAPLTNLEALMADYGMSAVPGMVVEADRNYYFSMYQQSIPHALLPELVTHAVTDPLINGNYRVLLNGAHGILVSEELPEKVTVTELLISSGTAYSKLVGSNLETYDKEEGDIDGPFALAAVATMNAGGENESNVVWIGSATLVDETMNNYVSGGNQDLFLNMLSYLCEPEAGAYTIHAKPVTNMKYLTMESSTSALLAIFVVAIIPMAFLAWGVVIWFRRKRK